MARIDVGGHRDLGAGTDAVGGTQRGHELTATARGQRDTQLTALLEIMGTLSSTASVDEVLESVAREVVSATGAASCGSFLMRDPDGSTYYRIVGLDPNAPDWWSAPDPPDPLALEVLETGVPVCVPDCSVDPRCDAPSRVAFNICSAMVFPLVHRGTTLAAACCTFSEPHEFTDMEVAVVMAIASVAAMAVAHSHVDEENVRLAIAEERNRLSKELHDSTCQSLAATKIQLSMLLEDPSLSDAARGHAREALSLVEGAYADTRDVVHSFRAAGTVGDGFPAAFESYVRDFSRRTGVAARWMVDTDHFAALSPDATLQAARVLGETLTNVRKHAHAGEVVIESRLLDDAVEFTTTDDGVGFDPSGAPGEAEGHFGLKVMEERAALAGGRLSVERVEPHGTRVVLTIPRRQR